MLASTSHANACIIRASDNDIEEMPTSKDNKRATRASRMGAIRLGNQTALARHWH